MEIPPSYTAVRTQRLATCLALETDPKFAVDSMFLPLTKFWHKNRLIMSVLMLNTCLKNNKKKTTLAALAGMYIKVVLHLTFTGLSSMMYPRQALEKKLS